tara:strand:- start:20531 stop:21007 length:477 start_codon:yes stop_codon:yes gene_type:complete
MTYLLLLGIPLIISILFIIKYYNKYKESQKLITKEKLKLTSYIDYIDKINFEMEGGFQLRKGFIQQNLTFSNNGSKEQMVALIEVEEIKRTIKRSQIKVISHKVINGDKTATLQNFKDYYDGWIDNSIVEWMRVIDGREATIDMLLKELESELVKNEN